MERGRDVYVCIYVFIYYIHICIYILYINTYMVVLYLKYGSLM